MRGPRVEALRGLVELVDDPTIASGQLDRAADDGREHGLEVERGADRLADLAERPELLDRPGELGRAGLQRREQPRVLDGDGCLVGEGLHQSDLTVGERANFESVAQDHAQQLVRPEHGDREYGSKGLHLPRAVGVLGVGLGIMDVDGAPLEGGARRGAAPSGSNGIPLNEGYDLGGGVVGCHDAQALIVEAEDERSFGLAQPDPVLRQRLEHRLEIERGATDHLEELAGRRLLLECAPQLVVSRLQLCEQPDVLDRDHRLVGEGLEERDLPAGRGRSRDRATAIEPMGRPSRSIGTATALR